MGLTWGDRAPLVPRGPAAATAEQAVPRLAQSSPTALPPAASIDEGAPQLRVATDTSALAPVQLVDTGPLAIGATSAVSSMPAEAPKDGAGETRPAAQSQSGGNGSPADPPAPLPASTTADSADPLAPLPAAAAAGTQPAPTVVAPAAPITPLVNRTAPARLISGALVKEDNPRGRFRGTVTVDFAVQPNGQVTGCRASASSGDRALDLRTCQLVEQRLRFSPALNAQGRPHASQARATYAWGVRHRPLHKRLWELVRR
jgi:TonB family protein